MKVFKVVVFFIAFVSVANAQDYKFGKVSKEELKEKYCPMDSSANAAVLYRNVDIEFRFSDQDGFTQYREVHERIKIYNSEGYDWANKNVYLYKGDGGSSERIGSVKGFTYNLVNGKIEKDKLKNEGVFEEEYNDYTEISKITMPNIQDGSVIEYTYQIISPFYQIDDVELQTFIPIKKMVANIATPQFLSFNRFFNPRAEYIADLKEKKNNKTFYSTSKERSGFGVSATTFTNHKSEYFDNVIMIDETDIPALKDEAFVGNIMNYQAKLSLELAAFLTQTGFVEKSFTRSWEDVSKTIYNYDSFGGQLNKSNFYKDDIAGVLEGSTDPFEKAAILHSYVKSKVKWNGNTGFTSHNGIRSAYKDGVGNVGDINLLLTSMLKSEGINAYPVLVSTKSNGIPLFPTRKGFNYVICLVENEGKYILLDATEPYSSVNIIPARALNWQGRLIKDEKVSGWISLRPNDLSSETTSLNVKINEDFTIEGKVRQSMDAHLALNYRDRYAGVSTEDHIKKLEKNKGDIEISELEIVNTKDISKPLNLTYNYHSNEGLDEIGGNIYFSPLFFMVDKENPFKLEERSYPIDFVMPMEQKYIVNIIIPDGYKVESMPKSEILKFKENTAQFSYVGKINGKYLQMSINLTLFQSLIDPLDYKGFKTFFENMLQKQNEQVVLTKA